MLELPYGLADFPRLIRGGYVYVDRTQHIRHVEALGPQLLFIRPRRFGKSLWLSTLAAYYDLRTAPTHDEIFGGLAVGNRPPGGSEGEHAGPTPDAHRYFVLSWDFSEISPSGTVEDITDSLNGYVNSTLESFLIGYRDHLPEVRIRDDAKNTLRMVLTAVRQTGHPLYLLIDEYDNFANEVMVRDQDSYRDLVHGDGPFKELMKVVKAATQGKGLERLFVTGVSPVVMSDISSGLNILTDAYQEPELNALCGFTGQEVDDLLELVRSEAERDGRAPAWRLAETRAAMRDWYNGYCFSTLTDEKVYNPTLALYFLRHLQRHGTSPRQMLDDNLGTDEDKLRFVSEIVAGRQSLIDRLQSEAPLEIPRLTGRLKLRQIVERSGDLSFLASFLTFFGMLTIAGESPAGDLRLVPPNLVVRKLYVDQVKELLLPHDSDRGDVLPLARAVATNGEIAPLLAFVEEKIFPTMSNRDYRFMDEHALKMVFLTLLFNDVTHLVVSELDKDSEINRSPRRR